MARLSWLCAISQLRVRGRSESEWPIEVAPLALISARRSIAGWPSGTASDSEDTMDFSVLSTIRPLIETYPLERASDAYERMMSGRARFRVVLTTDASDN
jgi:D-arabinose 1-dehydrogenase-like Zn-dependent alcohol dehydrogenase